MFVRFIQYIYSDNGTRMTMQRGKIFSGLEAESGNIIVCHDNFERLSDSLSTLL